MKEASRLVGSQLEENPSEEMIVGVSEEPTGGVRCPECGSRRIWKDGLRFLRNGEKIQRFICRACGYRFSEPVKKGEAKGSRLNPPCNKETPPEEVQGESNEEEHQEPSLNIQVNSQGIQALQGTGRDYIYPPQPSINRRVCVGEGPSKNSASQGLGHMEGAAKNGTQTPGEISKERQTELLFNFAWWMKKQGYAESTIEGRVKILRILAKRGADLLNPESVKEAIAEQEWSMGRKANAVDAYSCLLLMLGETWDPPIYKKVDRLPFIPTETEIDQLIAGCGKKTAALLQLLKETGMRIGEAWRLRWVDIDFENRTLMVTPEKGSEPRILRISNTLVAMLQSFRRVEGGGRIFGRCLKSQRRLFYKFRRRTAEKLKNPRILRITFHTFRHWKATMEYHKTRDILYVMRILGHKRIQNTLKYTQLVNLGDSDYVARVAKTVEEACQLVEAGFDYVCEIDGAKLFRKRK